MHLPLFSISQIVKPFNHWLYSIFHYAYYDQCTHCNRCLSICCCVWYTRSWLFFIYDCNSWHQIFPHIKKMQQQSQKRISIYKMWCCYHYYPWIQQRTGITIVIKLSLLPPSEPPSPLSVLLSPPLPLAIRICWTCFQIIDETSWRGLNLVLVAVSFVSSKVLT